MPVPPIPVIALNPFRVSLLPRTIYLWVRVVVSAYTLSFFIGVSRVASARSCDYLVTILRTVPSMALEFFVVMQLIECPSLGI